MGAARSREAAALATAPVPQEALARALEPLLGRLLLCSGEQGEVVVYKLQETPAPVLARIARVDKVPGATAVEWLVVHPVLPRVYAFSSFWKPMTKVRALQTRHGEMAVLGIDAASGQLSRLAALDSGGHQPCAGCCSPDGSLLAVAHYLDGRVSLFPLDDSGQPRAEGLRVMKLPWKGVAQADEERLMDGVTGPLCHGVAFSPSGRWVLACDAGQGRLVVFPTQGSGACEAKVTEVRTAMPTSCVQGRLARRFGQRPRHAAFHPSGRYVYVLYEVTNRVTAHAFEEQTGLVGPAVQELGSGSSQDGCCCGGLQGVTAAAEVAVSPDGACLVVSNRGIGSSSTLASFAITESGRLEPRSQVPALGKMPRHFILHGSLVLAGLEASGAVAAFSCSGEGRLAPLAALKLGEEMAKKGPQCVQLFPAC